METYKDNLSPRLSKTCDECKGRKVKCIISPGAASCRGCLKRKATCKFSHTRRLLRKPGNNTHPAEPRLSSSVTVALRPVENASPETYTSGVEPEDAPTLSPSSTCPPEPELYIDRLLERPGAGGINVHDDSIFKSHEDHITSSNLAFFSESRIRFLSHRLGHDKVRELIERVSSNLGVKHHSHVDLVESHRQIILREPFTATPQPYPVSPDTASSYVKAYFEKIQPLFPFIDRAVFEERTSSPELAQQLASNLSFSALYHAVLALGCQYRTDQTFGRSGQSWQFYDIALGLVPHLLLQRETLVNLQAVVAMAIYAMNVSCISVGESLCLEAARMAQSLGIHRVMTTANPNVLHGTQHECYRTFWVVYLLERQVCFLTSRSPCIADYDIGCPIPPTPEAHIEGFDSFVTLLRLARLCSKAYRMLFSVSATMKSPEEYLVAVDCIRNDLVNWRSSIPSKFRPDDKPDTPPDSAVASYVLLRVHCMYYALVMSLCRLDLHVGSKFTCQRLRMDAAQHQLMGAAKALIQLTTYIDIRPYTPMWITGTIPMSAMFVLFDLVVHNPAHPNTDANLSLLDMAAGYFGRFEYAMGGAVPASMLSGFAHMANQFIRDYRSGKIPSDGQRLQGQAPYQRPNVNTVPGINSHHSASLDSLLGPIPVQGLSSDPMAMTLADGMLDDDLMAGFDFTNMFDCGMADLSAGSRYKEK